MYHSHDNVLYGSSQILTNRKDVRILGDFGFSCYIFYLYERTMIVSIYFCIVILTIMALPNSAGI